MVPLRAQRQEIDDFPAESFEDEAPGSTRKQPGTSEDFEAERESELMDFEASEEAQDDFTAGDMGQEGSLDGGLDSDRIDPFTEEAREFADEGRDEYREESGSGLAEDPLAEERFDEERFDERSGTSDYSKEELPLTSAGD